MLIAVIKVGIKSVELIVLVDNHPHPEAKYRTGWGLSIYIVADETKILFDTGPNSSLLKENAEKMDIDISKIDFCIISHMHMDHLGGIEYVANKARNISLYLPANSYHKTQFDELGFKTTIIPNFQWLKEGIALSGIFRERIPEQALLLNIDDFGALIIVGCSHPGIAYMADRAGNYSGIKIGGIIGGWHLGGYSPREILSIVKSLMKYKPRFLIPIHCSGERVREIMRSKYSEIFIDGYVGMRLRIVGSEITYE